MQEKTNKCNKCQKAYRLSSVSCNLCKSCVEKYPYFLSFVEEGFAGVTDRMFGRVEVYSDKEPTEHAVDELRFLFKANFGKEKLFYKFREKWDFQNVSKNELEKVKKDLKNFFNESGLL